LLKFCQIRSQFSKKIAKQEGFAKILAKITIVLAKFWQKRFRGSKMRFPRDAKKLSPRQYKGRLRNRRRPS
jgi:hypothetical protein